VAALLAWWFSRNQEVDYTSTAELSTGYMDVSPIDYNSGGRNNTVLFNNVIQTLQSNQILDQVSYALLLHDLHGSTPFVTPDAAQSSGLVDGYPGGKNGLITSLTNKADSFYVLDLALKEDRMIRELADRYGYSPDALLKEVKIGRLEGSDFIVITATMTSPALSAFVANQICRRFLALYQNRLGQASEISLDTLRNLVETKKQILDNKLNLLQGGDDLALSGSVGMLGTLQGQLTQQKASLIAAQVALESVNQQINSAGNQGGLANNEEVLALRTNIDNLYAKYVNSGSTDVDLLNQIDKLRANLQQKLSSIGGGARSLPLADLERQKMDLQVKTNVARETMKDLQNKINSLQGAVQSSAAKQGMMQGIQSEIEIARQQYELANKLYNDALNRNIFPGNDFKQVLQASPPLHPNPSEKAKIIGFAGVGVFFFASFLLLFFEFIDPAIKSPAYLKANLTLPLLANLKNTRIRGRSVEEMFHSDTSELPAGFKEQVKQLRYEVEHASKKMLLVAGYHAGSGRTMITECLAGGLSLSNRKVLMVDANFRNNTLTQKYSAKSVVESYKAHANQAVNDKAIASVSVSGGSKNVFVIGCDKGEYTPGEVLPEHNLFTCLRGDNDFDYVLIDCSSLSQGPDCKELLQYIDAVILVFAADQPLTEEDKKLISFLDRNGVDILGAVLNRVPEYCMDI